MATISTLAVNLIARTSAFERSMKRSKQSVHNFQAGIKSTVTTVARFASGLAAAAGIGGMGFMLKRTMAMIDQTAKLSDRIGITTEALIGLRHAASIAGLSTEQLDKALEIFTRRMGEVKSGSGEAKRGLEALGLSASEMMKQTPEKALGVIADRINQLGTQAEKSAAAYFLFGRSGAQLLNLFANGSKGLAEMQDEARRLGLTFNRIDAAKVEAANDAIQRLKSSFQGIVNTVTVRLAPAIKTLADFMTVYRDSVVNVIKNTVTFAAKTYIAIKVIKLMRGTINLLIKAYANLAVAKGIVLFLSGPAGWVTLAAGAALVAGAFVGMNDAIDGSLKKLKTFATSTGTIDPPETSKFMSSTELAEKAFKKLNQEILATTVSIQGAEATTDDFKKELLNLSTVIPGLKEQTELFKDIDKSILETANRIKLLDTSKDLNLGESLNFTEALESIKKVNEASYLAESRYSSVNEAAKKIKDSLAEIVEVQTKIGEISASPVILEQAKVEKLTAELAEQKKFLKDQTEYLGIQEDSRDVIFLKTKKYIALIEKSLADNKAAVIERSNLEKKLATLLEAKRLESQRKVFDELTGFVNDLQDDLDTLGMTNLEKELHNIKKLSDKLTGDFKKDFESSVQAAAKMIDQLTAKQEEIKKQQMDINDLRAQAQDLAKTMLPGEDETGPGRFQEIRTPFIDVAALNPSTKDNAQLQVTRQIAENGKESNKLLRTLVQQDLGNYQV